jgi:hypothetical protein
MNKMDGKLMNFYSGIMEKEILKGELTFTMLRPKNIDELTNIVSLAHKYRYNIIVRMEEITKRGKILFC